MSVSLRARGKEGSVTGNTASESPKGWGGFTTANARDGSTHLHQGPLAPPSSLVWAEG